MEKQKHKTVYLDWVPVEVTYTPAGQTYEIYVDAIIKASAVSAPKATFNVQKTADVGADEVVSQESTFSIEKTADINGVAQPDVERLLSLAISLSLQHRLSLGLSHSTFGISMNLHHAKVGIGIMPMYQIALRVVKVSG